MYGDKIKKASRIGLQMYKDAFGPLYADVGTQYPCRQIELDFHNRGKFTRPNKGPFVSAIEATTEIVQQNNETRRTPAPELAAIDRLTDAILDAEEYGYGPDIILKAFADLDLVFFDGRLRGNVCVQWASDEYFQTWQVPPGAWGFTVRPEPGEKGQCRVKLNAQTILVDASTDTAFKTMFGTMLHEMCHAYEHVRCFPEECDQGGGHDKHFRTKIHAVHRRAYHLLGLWAIDKRESYRKDHFMSEAWAKEWRDTSGNTEAQKGDEGKGEQSRKHVGSTRANKSKTNRGHVEAGCMIM